MHKMIASSRRMLCAGIFAAAMTGAAMPAAQANCWLDYSYVNISPSGAVWAKKFCGTGGFPNQSYGYVQIYDWIYIY